MKTSVLFVCVHNSARSQMAEAFLAAYGGGAFAAESAGLEPGALNPLAVAAMKEIGIDISGNKTKSVFDLANAGRSFDYVITVCDESAAGRCPTFPGKAAKRLHWNFPDPASFTGSYEERMRRTCTVRDTIRAKIEEFIRETKNTG
jgi:arsenate reductase